MSASEVIFNQWFAFVIVVLVFIHAKKIKIFHHKNPSTFYLMFFSLLCFIGAVLLAVLLFFIWPLIVFYRLFVWIYLQAKYGNKFRGLFKGPDVMWAMETPESRSIVNVLVLLETSQSENELLNKIRRIVSSSILKSSSHFFKLRWRRNCKMGYYFWVDCKNNNVNDFVRPLEMCEKHEDGILKRELELVVGKYCNTPLPFNDTGTWEVLVGQQNVVEGNATTGKRLPLIFRVHHSIGDGMALLRLLIEVIADPTEPDTLRQSNAMENNFSATAEFNSVQKINFTEPKQFTSNDRTTDISSKPTAKERDQAKVENQKLKLGNELKSGLENFMPQRFSSNGCSKIENSKSTNCKERCCGNISKTCKFQRPQKLQRNRSISTPLPCDSPFYSRTALQPSSTWGQKHEERNYIVTDRFENHHLRLKESIFLEQNDKSHSLKLISIDIQPNLKLFLLNFCIAVMLSFVCIKQTLQLYYMVLYPKIRQILKFCYLTPYVVFCQLHASYQDDFLYGQQLSGEKIVAWVADESNLKNGLRSKINNIRKRCSSSTKFSHVLYACLSKSLHKYYLSRGSSIPSFINVVIPTRLNLDQSTSKSYGRYFWEEVVNLFRTKAKEELVHNNKSTVSEVINERESFPRARLLDITRNQIELNNNFSVAIMKLPIGAVPLNEDAMLLDAIQSEYHRLGNAPDYWVNYWLLRWVCHWLPNLFLEPIFKGAPCTLVFSNLPGPQDIIHVAQNSIREIIFWVPNRGLTGIGVGMISYCGRFNTGIIIDRNISSRMDDAQRILNGIYEEAHHFLAHS